MTIQEFMRQLYAATDATADYAGSCDTLKIGNPDAELRKIAVAMFATAPVLRAAAAWGANLLIVHEPTFYRFDSPDGETAIPPEFQSVIAAKQELIRTLGLTVCRFHDHPHHRVPDLISEGQTHFWSLKGRWLRGPYFAVNRFVLDDPLPVLEIARTLEKEWGIRHVRICGSRETQVKTISLCFGIPGHVEAELQANDLVLTGEIVEWMHGEFARDCVEILGQSKSLLVLGHIPSERQGMRLLAERIPERWPEFDCRYFECGEVYAYADSFAPEA